MKSIPLLLLGLKAGDEGVHVPDGLDGSRPAQPTIKVVAVLQNEGMDNGRVSRIEWA
ncbi:hypothetical protein ACO9S2_01405 [Nitrospira sp. NS4]|uniref:hypothetical protein n=1 Tax=Nitrospira sp. NS4 TaxID=3414498 RepID=UPI003C2CF252